MRRERQLRTLQIQVEELETKLASSEDKVVELDASLREANAVVQTLKATLSSRAPLEVYEEQDSKAVRVLSSSGTHTITLNLDLGKL